MTRPYPFPAEGALEPAFEEMFADPVLHAVLARDGIQPAELAHMIAEWRMRRAVRSLEFMPAA